MNIDDIISQAEEIAHDEIPSGSGASPEVTEALTRIFKQYPGKYFKSTKLADILNRNGCQVDKIGNVLFAMKNKKLCSQVSKGVYRDYTPEFDHNMKVRVTESEGSE